MKTLPNNKLLKKIDLLQKLGGVLLLISILTLVFLFTGNRGQEPEESIAYWIDKQTKKINTKIEPLPKTKEFTPTAFNANINPFVTQAEIMQKNLASNQFTPNKNRQREPLEMFAIEQLKMTGKLLKDGKRFALIKTNDGRVHTVTIGNYLGLNHGKITDIKPDKLVIEERVFNQDKWELRKNSLPLEYHQKQGSERQMLG